MEYGLIGGKLGHSFSPRIHRELAGYEYALKELRPEELESFLRKEPFRGINVTIPYKQAVIPFLDRLSERARAIGSVNTILKGPDGRLWGDNTDYAGFRELLRHAGMEPRGRKCLVLGSGGASRTAVACLKDLGAREVRVISRSGEDHYGNLDRHRDAEILVNATPVGMYPGNGEIPVHPELFPKLEGVADLIYNPARTALLLEAERLGIPCENGLRMLVAQAREAAGLFLGKPLPEAATDRVVSVLAAETANWVLIGMPGSGKSTLGRLLAERTGRPFADTDQLTEEKTGGLTCGAYLRRYGEEAFRRLETEAIRRAGAMTGAVIATGGGAVTRPENRDLLRQNGILFHLERPMAELPDNEDRPLSDTAEKWEALRKARAPLYEAWRDRRIDSTDPEAAAADILRIGGWNG